ncbi:MAG: T9SS type A sorting domain-containing protein [Flavobacteriales bacterium]
MAVDSTLDPLWAKHYLGNGGVQVVKELPNGDLLAGMNTEEAGAVVARLDASGNTIWSKSLIRPNGMVHDILLEADDTFIITGTTDSTAATNLFEPLPASFQPKLFMMKLDGDGTVQWCKGYDSAPYYWNTPKPSRIVRTLDGNYAVLATLGYPGSIMFYRPFLMKTDQNGDTLWTRSVGRSGFDQYASDLLAVSDGGFVVSGGIWGDLPSNYSGLPLIFKTDSLGRSACWPRHQQIEVVDLFPTDSSITLTYEEGILGLPAFINDTLLGPMTIYSGCEFSTGIQRYTSSPPRLYPNPTPGRFTVEFADPLMAESYYSLFDTMGKLLLQRPLPTGATVEEVDLTRFGSGSYVIKFTSPDGVCYERVVVE